MDTARVTKDKLRSPSDPGVDEHPNRGRARLKVHGTRSRPVEAMKNECFGVLRPND